MAAIHPQSCVVALFLEGEYRGLLVETIPLDKPMPRSLSGLNYNSLIYIETWILLLKINIIINNLLR